MKVAVAQINTTVGDFAGNIAKIQSHYQEAIQAGAELVVFPELSITGYPPRDFLLNPRFVERNLDALQQLAKRSVDVGMIVGFVGRNASGAGRPLTNSVALLHGGGITATRSKTLLPTYDVFDEDRYFEPAQNYEPVQYRGVHLGLTICEDIWNDEAFWSQRRYRDNPPAALAASGAEIIINCSASPWHVGKEKLRARMLSALARKLHCSIIYNNLVGGNDELIFDGSSTIINVNGHMLACGRQFQEDLFLADTRTNSEAQSTDLPEEELLYRALVLGLRDYFAKCGFKSAVLGLSGGIDSALTAVLAVEALGAANVRGISLPSQYSSQGSLDDARALAHRLGIQYDVVPIASAYEVISRDLQSVFVGRPADTTEENIQARLRGLILMALSNKFGSLLLTTGNKSELAVGYCTLYGDMNGGLAVINDVPKTMVYRIARWVNRTREIIPTSSITKPPSAELRPNQTDQDSLPAYEVLDSIVEEYVENLRSPEDIIALGFPVDTVRCVIKLIEGSEYKRRQAAPGLKVTSKAFGVGRRIPIAHRFREG